MTAAEALPHLEEEARKRQGRRTDLEPTSGPTGPEVPDADPKRARAEAAELTGASERSVGRAKRVKESDPELADQVKAGEVALTAAEEKVTGKPNKDRSNGLDTKPDAAGRQQPTIRFGKGDKWQESTEPLTRYLNAWAKRLAASLSPPAMAAPDGLIQTLTGQFDLDSLDRPGDLVDALMEALDSLTDRLDAHCEAFAVLADEPGEPLLGILNLVPYRENVYACARLYSDCAELILDLSKTLVQLLIQDAVKPIRPVLEISGPIFPTTTPR